MIGTPIPEYGKLAPNDWIFLKTYLRTKMCGARDGSVNLSHNQILDHYGIPP